MATRSRVERPAHLSWRSALVFLLSTSIGFSACGQKLEGPEPSDRLVSYFNTTDTPSDVLIDNIPKYCDVYTLQECLDIFRAAFDAQAVGKHVSEERLTQMFLTLLRSTDPDRFWEESGMSMVRFTLETSYYDPKLRRNIVLEANLQYVSHSGGFVEFPKGTVLQTSTSFAETLGTWWRLIDTYPVWKITNANWLLWQDQPSERLAAGAEPNRSYNYKVPEYAKQAFLRMSRGFGSQLLVSGPGPRRAYKHDELYFGSTSSAR